jgi:hypothetical protein
MTDTGRTTTEIINQVLQAHGVGTEAAGAVHGALVVEFDRAHRAAAAEARDTERAKFRAFMVQMSETEPKVWEPVIEAFDMVWPLSQEQLKGVVKVADRLFPRPAPRSVGGTRFDEIVGIEAALEVAQDSGAGPNRRGPGSR